MVGLALHMRLADNKKNIENCQPYPFSQTTKGIFTHTDICKYTCTDSCTHALTVHTVYTHKYTVYFLLSFIHLFILQFAPLLLCIVMLTLSGGCSRLSQHVDCGALTFDPGDTAIPVAVTMGTPLTIQRHILRRTETERLRDDHTLSVLWLFGI